MVQRSLSRKVKVGLGFKSGLERKGTKVSETQNWYVHYFQNGDPQLERNRQLATMYDALRAACSLRQRHAVQHVGGPNGEKYDLVAIKKWCVENSKLVGG